MPEPDLSFDALMALLKEKDIRPCPACGHPEWGPAMNPLFVQSLDESGTKIVEGGFRAIALFCRNCGLMHLHNFTALVESDEDIADDPVDDDAEPDDPDQGV
jgi:hypothetical protein